jgi:hypothetical protein
LTIDSPKQSLLEQWTTQKLAHYKLTDTFG